MHTIAKTFSKAFKQFVIWIKFLGFQTMVTSPLEYSFISLQSCQLICRGTSINNILESFSALILNSFVSDICKASRFSNL